MLRIARIHVVEKLLHVFYLNSQIDFRIIIPHQDASKHIVGTQLFYQRHQRFGSLGTDLPLFLLWIKQQHGGYLTSALIGI